MLAVYAFYVVACSASVCLAARAEEGWNGGVLSLEAIQDIKQNIQTHINTRRVSKGGNVKFDCGADVNRLVFSRGYETVKTHWLHNNVSFDTGKRKSSHSYIATIQNAKPSDSGVYTCQIRYPNERPRVVRLETLVVDSSEPTLNATAFGSMDLSCQAVFALPHLEGFWIRWLHNGTVYAERDCSVWVHDNLHVYPVSEASSGIWECQLVNKVGKVWYTNRHVVQVHGAAEFAVGRYVQAVPDYILTGANIVGVFCLIGYTFCCLNKPHKVIHYGRSLYEYYDWRHSWKHGSSTVSLTDRKLDFDEFKTLLNKKERKKGLAALVGLK